MTGKNYLLSGQGWLISCNFHKIAVHTRNHCVPSVSPSLYGLWAPVSPTFLCHPLQTTAILPSRLSSTVPLLTISYLSSLLIHIYYFLPERLVYHRSFLKDQPPWWAFIFSWSLLMASLFHIYFHNYIYYRIICVHRNWLINHCWPFFIKMFMVM